MLESVAVMFLPFIQCTLCKTLLVFGHYLSHYFYCSLWFLLFLKLPFHELFCRTLVVILIFIVIYILMISLI